MISEENSRLIKLGSLGLPIGHAVTYRDMRDAIMHGFTFSTRFGESLRRHKGSR